MAKREEKPKSSMLGTVQWSVTGLHRAGVIDEAELREFDDLCLPSMALQETKALKVRVEKA
jgi:hypothetical protein